ncbi:MAG: shikimate kinase [Candidatus Micrarchaeia archaeon]
MNITLVGFMGTGKSSVGRLLARRLGMRFVDTDDVIEKETGVSISEIFAKHGEQKFRDIERDVVRRVALKDNLVISAGGGIVLRKENIDDLKRNGPVVCLSATPEEIWARVKKTSHRPLLMVDDPLGRIRELLAAREPAYALADACVDTTGLTVAEVSERVIAAVEKWKAEERR